LAEGVPVASASNSTVTLPRPSSSATNCCVELLSTSSKPPMPAAPWIAPDRSGPQVKVCDTVLLWSLTFTSISPINIQPCHTNRRHFTGFAPPAKSFSSTRRCRWS
jgi:hypothetical protein